MKLQNGNSHKRTPLEKNWAENWNFWSFRETWI